MSTETHMKLKYIAGVGVIAAASPVVATGTSNMIVQSTPRHAQYEAAASNPARWEQSVMNSIVPSMERLRELASLPQNWDSYGAHPLSSVAISVASALIAAIDEAQQRVTGRHSPPWMIAPVPDGGVQIEWLASVRKVEIQIEPDGTLGYLLIDRSHEIPSYTERHGVSLPLARSVVESMLAV